MSGAEFKRHQPQEEAATVAEANVRTKKKHTASGYYSYLSDGLFREQENYDSDRVTLLGKKKSDTAETVKGQKGSQAVKTLNARFGKTKISKLDRVP